MGKIIVTGASGGFGGTAASLLLERVAAEDLILLSRTPEKLAAFAERGAIVRSADFNDPASLRAATAGGEKMLLISTTHVGERVRQHRAAIDAAVGNGVRHIVYTSIIDGGNPAHPSVEQHDHYVTEQAIERSGAAWTHLRDSQYSEAVATAMVVPALRAGSKPDNCGDGRIGFVSRDDCAAVAAGVLTQDGHANQAYDVTGPELISIPEAMALAAELAGKPIVVEPVDDAGMYAYFDSLGVARRASDIVPDGPIPWASEGMVTFGQAIREGYFARLSDTVERVTGRAPKLLREVMIAHRDAWPR